MTSRPRCLIVSQNCEPEGERWAGSSKSCHVSSAEASWLSGHIFNTDTHARTCKTVWAAHAHALTAGRPGLCADAWRFCPIPVSCSTTDTYRPEVNEQTPPPQSCATCQMSDPNNVHLGMIMDLHVIIPYTQVLLPTVKPDP